MPIANHYDVLEVSPKASAEVIRAAYKSLMQRHHPDKSANGIEPTRLAASIAQAYEVLSDPQQRLVYDQTLLVQHSPLTHLPHHAGGGAGSLAARRTAATAGNRLSTWYAPVLVISIICAGGAILVMSKKKPAGGAPSQQMALSTPRLRSSGSMDTDPGATPNTAATAQLTANSVAVTDEGLFRTLSGFVTDLSVELNPDTQQSAAIHVLRVPSIGLRLGVSEPDRWTHRIQAQRTAIIQQLLVTLASAKYLELIKPDGDVYLKKLIEDSVVLVTGLERSSALPIVGQPGQGLQPIEVLLPVSFSVQ